jgi:formylglycine-generating enzyme required for sulfatase activity
VTVAEYACAVRAKAVREPSVGTWGSITWADQLQRPDHPVVRVSWHHAWAYAAWLAQVTGQPWRLPTEAEWEKAARGTDGRLYPWGDAFDGTRCNTSASESGATTPVGTYADRGDASPYGVHDLAGNVWEWTSSLYKPYPYSPNGGREQPQSAGNRVLRGGSSAENPPSARVVFRYHADPVSARKDDGFRLVLAVPSSR